MKIKIDLKIFVFAIIFYFTKQIEIYALLMIFALLHECGHLLAGLILGFKPEKISIMPMGVSISFKVKLEDYNKKIQNSNILSLKKIIVALAGPIINVIIAILFMCINFNLEDNQRLNVVYANLLICIFNLLPIYPLDGGRILRQLLKIKFGVVTSITYTHIIQNVTIIFLTIISSMAIYYLKNIAILFIITYLWFLLINENKKYKIIHKIM